MTNHQMIYVFWDEKNQAGHFTIVNSTGQEQQLSIDEIESLAQQGTIIYLVLPTKSCSIYQIELPKLSAKELPLAIQSILEDKVIQPFSQLWWCYQNNDKGGYDVLVWDKVWLSQVKDFWTGHGIDLTGISIDWFALHPREILVVNSSGALIRSDDTNAYLTMPLLSNWLNDKSFESHHFYYFQYPVDYPGAIKIEESFPVWVWKRFQEKTPFNINAPIKKFDIAEHITREQLLDYFPKVTVGTIVFIGLVFLGVFFKNTFVYFQNLNQFKAFSKSSASEIQANLSRYQYQQSQKKQFWSIWVAIQKSYQPRMMIQQLQFEQNMMQITLEIQSIASLQTFKNQLTRHGIKVTQPQIQSIPNGVRVVLKLQGRA
jgi:general secretion pathway protein L